MISLLFKYVDGYVGGGDGIYDGGVYVRQLMFLLLTGLLH
jgi:hypothetical protein